jgi:monoterpene epsilon-lactone hydrolase
MTDRSEIEAIRALLSSKPRPAGWAERRQRLDEVGSAWPVAEDVKLGAVALDGIPGEWSIAPGSDANRVLMFFHGGGYCSGSIASHRRMVTEAGRCAGARTLRRAARLRVARLAVDRPDDVRINDGQQRRRGPLIHKPYLEELATAYLPATLDRKDPRVSALFADLRGFPPVLVQGGSDETLLDDAVRFAAAAGAADVAVTLEIWPRMIHAWPLWNARLEAGRRALARAGAFISAALSAT